MFPAACLTSRTIMRLVTMFDAAAIFDGYAQDRDVTRFLTWKPHRSRDDTDAYIAHCLATDPAHARTYVLCDRRDGRVRGAMDLRRFGGHRLEFGYVLARRWWGQGLMTEALREVVAWVFTQPALFRIGAVCDVENVTLARVMEKADLTLEGRLHRWSVHPNIGDEPRDCLIYGKCR